MLISVSAFSQTKIINKTTADAPAYVSGPTYAYFWGTAASDTLGASDTLDQVIRIKGDGLLQIEFQLDRTKVSGKVTNNFFVESSLDGTNWTRQDTIAHSNVATGVTLSTDECFDNWNWPYMRIRGVSGATAQKAWYKGWLIIRY